jgi:hypothetical protein
VVGASLFSVGAAAPVQAASGTTYYIQNFGTSYCLEGYPGPGSPSVATNIDDLNSNLTCASNAFDKWKLTLIVGDTYTVQSYTDPSYCLSQNNAGSAYLTKCTGNAYQQWILALDGTAGNEGWPTEAAAVWMLNQASSLSNTSWCLSSNFTPPPNYASWYGSVYMTAFNAPAIYHEWSIYQTTVPGA